MLNKFRFFRSFDRRFSTATQVATKEVNISNIDKKRAFMETPRDADKYRDPKSRITDWNEINLPTYTRSIDDRVTQAARCMDCGTPFCQSYTGCPINNLIPEWNDLVHKKDFKNALDRLHKTNNFPEFTGRVCPAPCEGACVLGIVDDPVTIKNIEYSIIDYGFENNLVQPRIVNNRTALNVAIIGSGPSGLACADQLNQKGHNVFVYEREDQIGGLLMYGIPNMKLDKNTVKRRVDLLEKEGITFYTNASVKSKTDLHKEYDAIVLAIGSTIPRDLGGAPGRDLKGIHFAMEFLTKNQKKLLMSTQGTIHSAYDERFYIDAKDKNVVVIGGGDTGNDCIGTAMRQGCKSLINLEIMNKPPNKRNIYINPWPEYPRTYLMDYGHEEVKMNLGYDPRKYAITAKEFIGDDDGNVKAIKTVNIHMDAKKNIHVIPNTEKIYPCELVLLSMGFISPETQFIDDLNLKYCGNAKNNDYTTNVDNVFTAGDCRRGQSLVVWAIAEGRGAANAVQKYFNQKGLIE